MSAPAAPVLAERRGPIVVITFNRPEVRNALDAETLRLLGEHLREAEAAADVRVIVLTGAGDKAFVAGADIRELQSRTMYTEMGGRGRLMRDACTLLDSLPKPTIAAINGVAAGGGCELALACDMRFLSSTARIGLPEINLGIFPGGGGTQRLMRLCGRGIAAELVMTGKLIDAAEAERIGLVNRVVVPEGLMAAVFEVAEHVASKSPFALAVVKEALRVGANGGQAEGIAYENKLFSLCMQSDDKREGVAAFLEKRSPTFTGR